MNKPKLWEIRISKSFYWYGEKPPSELTALRCADDDDSEYEVDAHDASRGPWAGGLDQLVHHAGDDDMTLGDALTRAEAKEQSR